jgi:DNA-binding NarL/FixJ family response regulator
MNSGAKQSLVVPEEGPKRTRSNDERRANLRINENGAQSKGAGSKPRVFVAAENRLLREALSRMLVKGGNIEVAGVYNAGPFRTEDLLKEEANILLLTSRGSVNEDLSAIRKVRASAPNVQILLIGVTGEETEFLLCVRAGVRGYLPKNTSAKDVVEGVRAVQAGEAVCPGTLCALLFHYFEREATSFPSASVHQRMGLTRREQQLIPLIAEGLTNKEIANRFCLSEQTVKNHLYRMKHKVGAGDRLGIVQVCRIQGFMV